jgi:hypothetical protein
MRRAGLALPSSLAILLLAAGGTPAVARTLAVGSGLDFATPSEAARTAADGDTVTIAAGTYYDCAIWHAGHLTIAGAGSETAVITDKACAAKAAFVIQGDGVTVSGLTFQRIRVPDGNGAGIRAEGRDLTVRDSRFINNEVGILAGGGGSLLVTGSSFGANKGGTPEHPLGAVSATGLDRLRIEHSVFERVRGGLQVWSSAGRTEIMDSHLLDEGGGMSGPLVSVDGGVVIVTGNTIDLAPGAAERPGAILVYGDAGTIVLRGNTLVEPMGTVPLLRNWSGVSATADGNSVPVGVEAVSDAGVTYHRLRSRAAALRAAARDMVGAARHQVANMARALGLLR